MPDVATAVSAHEAALSRLESLKAVCREVCDDAEAAVAAIEAEARARAVVAVHVLTHAENSIGAVLSGGRLAAPGDPNASGAFVSQDHIAEVARVAMAVAGGADAVQAAGADPAHVALFQAAADAHAQHGDALAAAYAELSRTSHERVAAESA